MRLMPNVQLWEASIIGYGKSWQAFQLYAQMIYNNIVMKLNMLCCDIHFQNDTHVGVLMRDEL